MSKPPEGSKPSHLRLAAQSNPKDIKREHGRRFVRSAVRELAANILRVTRGAGKPHEIGLQCLNVVEAFRSYNANTDEWPSAYDVQQMLEIEEDFSHVKLDASEVERRYGLDEVIRGALQVSASRLLGQRTQVSAGESELYSGMRTIDRAREAARQKWDARHRQAATAKKLQTRLAKKPSK